MFTKNVFNTASFNGLNNWKNINRKATKFLRISDPKITFNRRSITIFLSYDALSKTFRAYISILCSVVEKVISLKGRENDCEITNASDVRSNVKLLCRNGIVSEK